MRFATTGVLPWMRVFLLLDIRNLIQHSSRAAYDGEHSPENCLDLFFFFFQLVFYSSFGLKHCMVPRDLAFRVWEKLSTISGILVLVWVFIPYYCYYHYRSSYFILFIRFPFTWNSRQFWLASYRIGNTDDMMAHKQTQTFVAFCGYLSHQWEWG